MKKTQSIEWERPILDYRSPLTYELMMEYLNVFSERYKNIAVAYIGESILGRAIPAVTLGDPCTDSGVLSVRADGMDCEELAAALSARGVCVRAGLHCAPRAHMSAGTLKTGTVRFSFSPFVTDGQVDEAAGILKDFLNSNRN